MDLKLLAYLAGNGAKGMTLENLDDELPEGGDAELGSYAEQADAAFQKSEDDNVALEAIRDYTEQLAGLIRSKQITPISLGLIRHGVQHIVRGMGRELVMPALESVEDTSIEVQAGIALESFKSFLGNVVQEFVLGFKHHKDLIGDFLRTTSQITAKYEKKTLENKREWNRVRSEIQASDVSVGANGLMYFFAKGLDPKDAEGKAIVEKLLGKGKIIEAIREDLSHSKYILTQYQKAVIAEMRSLAAIVRGASFKSAADMSKTAVQVEKLKTPTELFDDKHAGAELLGATKLLLPDSKPRDSRLEGENKHKRLAEMAGAKHVTHAANASMTMTRGVNAASGAIGALALNAALPGAGTGMYAIKAVVQTPMVAALTSTPDHAYTFNVKEIPAIFDMAESYLDNVRACIGFERDIVKAMDDLEAAIEKADESAYTWIDKLEEDHGIPGEGEESKAAWHDFDQACHIFDHIVHYASALRRATQKPVHVEVARALRAAKYCNYLGLRAIHNADKKGDIAVEEHHEGAQANIQAMNAALEGLDEQYQQLEQEHADDDEKLASLGREKAVKEHEIREKFMLSSAQEEPTSEEAVDAEVPALEELHDAKYKKGSKVTCLFSSGPQEVRIVDSRMNGPKVEHLVKPKEDRNQYAVAHEMSDGHHGAQLRCSHVQDGMISDEKAREFFNFTGKEKVVATESYHSEIHSLDEALSKLGDHYEDLISQADSKEERKRLLVEYHEKDAEVRKEYEAKNPE